MIRYCCRGLLAVAAGWLTAIACHAGEVDENAFLALWKQRESGPARHAEMVAACERFASAYPASYLVPAVQGIHAWHLLAMGRYPEARTILLAMTPPRDHAIARAANRMALRWLTRLDREQVRAALSAWFSEHISFPSSLDALAATPQGRNMPVIDRWGKLWRYRISSYKHLPNTANQRYLLESEELGAASDLKKALAARYGGPASLKPVKFISSVGGRATIAFAVSAGGKPETVTLMEDSEERQTKLTFVSMQRRFLLVSDGDGWQVLPPPGADSL